MSFTKLSLCFLLTFGLATVGCDEAQYEDSVEDYNEEVVDRQEEIDEATTDGVITAEELEEVEDATEDVIESAGEVAEQKGDLIESKTD